MIRFEKLIFKVIICISFAFITYEMIPFIIVKSLYLYHHQWWFLFGKFNILKKKIYSAIMKNLFQIFPYHLINKSKNFKQKHLFHDLAN